jgi:hypothetical protein
VFNIQIHVDLTYLATLAFMPVDICVNDMSSQRFETPLSKIKNELTELWTTTSTRSTTSSFQCNLDLITGLEEELPSSTTDYSSRPTLPFVLGIAQLQDTPEDPFSSSNVTQSNSPSTFTVRINLCCRRGWPLSNLQGDLSYISQFSSSLLRSNSLSTPTHKPRRARFSMNSNKKPNMPSGNRALPPPPTVPLPNPLPNPLPLHPLTQIPQRMSYDHLHTSSTGSQESVMTQLPSSYHNSNGIYAVQDYSQNAYIPGYMGTMAPFATPDLSSNGTFADLPVGGSRSLNPNSANFQPLGFGANGTINSYSVSSSFGPSFGSDTSSNYQPPVMPHANSLYLPPPGIGHPSSYGGPGLYGGNFGVPYQSDYGAAAGPAGPALAPYTHYGPGHPISHFTPFNSLTGAPEYSAHGTAMGYGVGRNQNTSYPGMGYNAAVDRISTRPTSVIQNGFGGPYSSYPNHRSTQPPQPYTNPANVNRGKNSYRENGRNGGAFNRNNRSSNLATAPVINNNTAAKKLGGSQQGGPVRSPSTVLPPSPSKSRVSERSHRSSVLPAITGGPSAQNRRRIEFHPDTLNVQTPTPTLRSRRKQDISTGQASTAAWLEGVPNGIQREMNVYQSPPPKMKSLVPVGGSDIGTDQSASKNIGSRPLYNNPFGSLQSSQLTHFQTSDGIGNQEIGPSAALLALTNNGTSKPSLEVALKTNVLPIVEYCRLVKGDEWGVVRIKNVCYFATKQARLTTI